MTEDATQTNGQATNPCDPAPQPTPPHQDCTDLPRPEDLPKAPKPPAHKDCPLECDCPKAPTEPTTCLDELIAAQDKEIKEAERAQSFKDELKAIQDKTGAAKLEYTQAKYEALLKQWKKQDGQIVELVKKLTCAFPCWECMIECSVCTLVYALRDRERELSGRGVPFAPTGAACYDTADTLYDLQYWHERNCAARQANFDRVKAVLAAWEAPAQALDKALADDAKIIADAQNVMAPDAAKLVYDVFFLLIPRHLAIAPPRDAADKDTQTEIERKYADLLCACDDGAPDTCCGPDTGPLSLRQRLVGPLPYLLAPALYPDLICCLVVHRYLPAKEALATAEGELANAQNRLNDAKAALEQKTQSLADDAKANLLAFKCEPTQESGCGGGTRSGTAAPAPAHP